MFFLFLYQISSTRAPTPTLFSAYDRSSCRPAFVCDGESSDSDHNVLNVGQDTTESYTYSPDAVIDELMVFNGALNEADLPSLSAYIGISKN